MKKVLYFILPLMLFLMFTETAFAAFGELRYEVTNVSIKDASITFTGWAFIHRTHNFITVEDENGKKIDVKNEYGKIDNGDQKILIRALNGAREIETKVADGGKDSKSNDYNFYCQMYMIDQSNSECVNAAYKGEKFSGSKIYYPEWPRCKSYTHNEDPNDESNACKANTCSNHYGDDCYYEDIYFSITFDVTDANWENVDSEDDIHFEIAVSNADFESKLKNKNSKNYTVNGKTYRVLEYDNDYYTELEPMYVNIKPGVLVNDYIEVKTSTLSDEVKYIATDTIIMNDNWQSIYLGPNIGYLTGKSGTRYKLKNKVTNFGDELTNHDMPLGGGDNTFFGSSISSGAYIIYGKYDGNSNGFLLPCDPKSSNSCNGYLVLGSWVVPIGDTSFTIKVKKDKKCDVVPSPNKGIACNNNKTFSSDCKELTVNTSLGKTTVRISQTGTVSSVLTPTSIFQGGGFNFGILYYNTISWNYVSGPQGDAVVKEMKNKLKSYETYKDELKITELKINNDIYDDGFLYKECYTSNEKDNWNPGTELTVSCVFYFPEVKVGRDGNVSYSKGMIGNGISNKFYTMIDFTGKYNITAKIVGMNRIKDDVAKKDSKDKSKPWTGKWEDEFTECSVDVYPLFYTEKNTTNSGALNYKFIYRPIDITNPFPNRAAGINWFDWWSIESNRNRLKNTYKDLDYSIGIDNDMISKIKTYNKKQNGNGGYLDWYTMNGDESSFLKEYFGVGGN